jgi:nicotinamidase-related amidase
MTKLSAEDALVIVVDMQEKLLPAIHDGDAVVAAAARLVRGAKVLGLPVLWTEQNPSRLGRTVPPLAELVEDEPVGKLAFSCCGEEAFGRRLAAAGRRQVLLAGVETHVCIYQTATDLLGRGYQVQVVVDAVGSRRVGDREVALGRLARAGAEPTTVELALFEMLKAAEGEAFKRILRIVK